MGRKILMAVDDSIHSERMVKYAARMCSAANNVTYTLFNVQPQVPHILIESAEANPQTRAAVDELVRKNVDTGRYLAKKFKDLVVREGIPENRIETVSALMQQGLAKDILNRAEHGSYDAIVLARRGLTPSRDFFIGTVAAKVVEHALEIGVDC
jgi:nucleotide-binding universal stress UspA family protein